MQTKFPLLLSCLFVLLVTSCTPRAASPQAAPAALPETTTPAAPQESYAGSYDVTVSGTPAGTVTGTLTLMQDGETLSGNFVSGSQTTELKSVTQTDEGVRISFYSSEYQMNVDMNLRGAAGADELNGMTLGSYKTVAKRKM